ncbi:MAG: 4-(cytidine 5'-diphospho)-2-C-methyl-D-erythritol kinase, partial [Longimicrobiales bacterium]|nr:4-(cytidine 5'-diphospho)-2-C-methyl-D-erythritol kinase [Longimicrobiales bacterium]
GGRGHGGGTRGGALSRAGRGGAVRVSAPAKVNLTLRVRGRRADGYHEVETLLQAISLRDRVTLEVVAEPTFTLEVRGADVGPVQDNLVTRAVASFREAVGALPPLRVFLEKRIPAGAGLGGGSSDAGATLRALNLLLGGPLSGPALTALGGALGADVAFFAGESALALGEGRGERLTPAPPLPPRRLVLGLPDVHVSTPSAYRTLATARAAGHPVPPPLLRGRTPASWAEAEAWAVNDFEPEVPDAHPGVAQALAALRAEGVGPALLSGSGGAVFGLLPAGRSCRETLARLRARLPGVRWRAAATLTRMPPPRRVDASAIIR